MDTINILIADDHQMFVDGLAALLGDVPDIQILGTAANGKDALQLVNTYPHAHILIMDLNMPVMDGIQAARQLHKDAPAIKVLALTQNADGGSVSKALKAGAAGYLIKSSRKDEFLDAIRTIASGGSYVSEGAKEALVSFASGRSKPVSDNSVDSLSDREKEILKLIALEYTSSEIAERLYISFYTVETHRRNMIHKLKVRGSAGLVKVAMESGLLNSEEQP
jgi:DNA-binding NarL/FixJ family response regulator